ncbi:MAG: Rpn family recombination-promoting nuclease/putative transposase, partial [Oscillospiraceae bacterium]|nr:Rpn family recombination-promoting nuclease/putative transposase [Oscillospiraceae bacterium]
MKDFELLPRTNDLVFKKIFGDYKNTNILKDFLDSVLDLNKEDYEIIEILDPHSKIEFIDDKECVIDVKIRTKTGKIIDIEMQVKSSPIMRHRIVYYLSSMIYEQVKITEKFG